MKSTALLVITSICLTAGSFALANDIYKYTDENGTVHYVDRPTNAPSEERVQIASSKSVSRPETAESDAPDWRERRAARKDAQSEAAKAESEAQERKRLCQTQRDRLEEYKVASRLYRMDEQGERVYLNEEEIAEARQQVQNQIQEHCDS